MNTYQIAKSTKLRHADIYRMTKSLIKERNITNYEHSTAEVNRTMRKVINLNDVDAKSIIGMVTPSEEVTLKGSNLSRATIGRVGYKRLYSVNWWLEQSRNHNSIPERRVKDLSYAPGKDSYTFNAIRNEMLGIKTNHTRRRPEDPIVQYSLAGEFVHEYYNMDVLCHETGYKPNNILDACKRNRSHSGGYIWRSKGDKV